MEYKFTKQHTLLAKGIAIILMLVHHLFAFPDRIRFPYIGFFHIEQYIAEFGKLCVAIFLFLSGVGLYYSLRGNKVENILKSVDKVKNMYINYWIVFLLFVPIGFWIFDVKFNLTELVTNFLGIQSTYDAEWWFFRTYIALLITYPFISVKFSNNKWIAFFQSFLGFIFGQVLKLVFKKLGANDIITDPFISILIWSSCFYIGVFFAKFNIFQMIKNIFKKYRMDNRISNIAIILAIILLRKFIPGGSGRDALLSPIFVICFTNIVYKSRIEKVLTLLGKHSNNMWLCHTFYCYYYFQNVIFYPKFSLLIVLFLIIVSLATSYVINYIIDFILKNNKVISSDNIKLSRQ